MRALWRELRGSKRILWVFWRVISTGIASHPQVTVEPEDCGCGGGCANGIAVTGTKHYAGTLDVMLTPHDAGTFLLCVGGDVAATLEVTRLSRPLRPPIPLDPKQFNGRGTASHE